MQLTNTKTIFNIFKCQQATFNIWWIDDKMFFQKMKRNFTFKDHRKVGHIVNKNKNEVLINANENGLKESKSQFPRKMLLTSIPAASYNAYLVASSKSSCVTFWYTLALTPCGFWH